VSHQGNTRADSRIHRRLAKASTRDDHASPAIGAALGVSVALGTRPDHLPNRHGLRLQPAGRNDVPTSRADYDEQVEVLAPIDVTDPRSVAPGDYDGQRRVLCASTRSIAALACDMRLS
jgi:hypothetical protein